MLSAQEIQKLAGAVSSRALPDEIAETLPVVQKTRGGPVVLVLYYSETGRPNHRTVHLPDHAMQLDPYSGKVLRFWSCNPEDLGIESPLKPVAGAGIPNGMTSGDFFLKRQRFLEISPTVWEAFVSGTTDAQTAAVVQEYWHLFLEITKSEVAPFYVSASPEFFKWVRRLASNG